MNETLNVIKALEALHEKTEDSLRDGINHLNKDEEELLNYLHGFVNGFKAGIKNKKRRKNES
jgi:hypothetical protein